MWVGDFDVQTHEMKFTLQQKIFILKHWLKFKNYRQLYLDWEEFPEISPPSANYPANLLKKFEQTGSVNDMKRKRSKPVCNESFMETVATHFVETPTNSQRKAALQLEVPRTTLQRAMKFRPYRPRMLQALSEDDFDRRLQFCEEYLADLAIEPRLPALIIWIDEAQFKLNGHVNRHNSVYSSDENPHLIMTQELNVPGVTVWAGITHRGIIGPYFFENTVNGERYAEMLVEIVSPELKNSPVFEPFQELIWQQDGAPPHFTLPVRNLLNENFQEWIGRRGTWEWPARSCDLTCMALICWPCHLSYIVRSERSRCKITYH